MCRKIIYKTGDKIRDCVFIQELPPIVYGDLAHRAAVFICRCGKSFNGIINSVKAGNTASCGCSRKHKGETHGRTNTREYSIWTNMKTRCYNTNNEFYMDYGGRGILVCDEWKDDFTRFYADMGDCPSKRHSLDRIDNNKGYYKENCKWATKKAQANNKRNNVFIEYQGETKTIKQWCDCLKISYKLVYKRIKKFGWTVVEALETPIDRPKRYLYKLKKVA